MDNNDGPGFLEDVIESAGYKAICQKIQTFIPHAVTQPKLCQILQVIRFFHRHDIKQRIHKLFPLLREKGSQQHEGEAEKK